ncbi:unnamed protein product [Gongylonema pulchrum]|uniref:ANK_REP_REGION domain-containing protein n=1 Tax=Gongylonema pulchrum TaxID=637853 RepID=A0A183E9Y9_9BILA|nr:unnamed protein product [Gongylonema pulchrum]
MEAMDEKLRALLDTDEKESSLPADFKELEKQVGDEILDVLNESKDDSTILHRDTLLAEIKLKLQRMTIRFIDDFEICKSANTRVLAVDLWWLASCIHLSPRRHSTAVSLSVTDMSLQRLLVGSMFLDEADQQGAESLIFGFGSVKETTQVLFAIGKAGKSEDAREGKSRVEKALFR